jgi:phosphatidylinositol-3,4,5-trisphosphate 3-phosphatase/dual-specificity protein phosphatase PTEN
VTDQVIIMGYPASGIEGLYRNRKEDAIKFLEHRHAKNYWVFNFCPLRENSYDAEIFGGRVSRYPFPDHHAPPLAIMPLVAREMNEWLRGSPERVAVLHCKAGKGRSGTMACTYLLSQNDEPTPPKLQRSHSAAEWAKKRTDSTIDALPEMTSHAQEPKLSPVLETAKAPPSDAEGLLDIDSGGLPPRSSTPNKEKSFTDALKGVLDLHTARRMKPPSEKAPQKVKQGVSIPSQRRFLNYWALLLAHDAPKHMWNPSLPKQKVRITQLRLRMHETSAMKMGLVRAANKVIEKTSMAKGPAPGSGSSPIWASLARYDDRLVDLLEDWELHTRDAEGHMGRRRPASENRAIGEAIEEEAINELFTSGKWDNGKMVRSFAKFGQGKEDKKTAVDDEGEKVNEFAMWPMSDKRWQWMKDDIHKGVANDVDVRQTLDAAKEEADTAGLKSEHDSITEISNNPSPQESVQNLEANIEQGVVVDAGRELRIKLYIGQVFIGWMWFIPTFHMPPLPSTGIVGGATPAPKSTFTLTRKEIDFPIGLGSAIVDFAIDMEWVPATSPAVAQSAGSSTLAHGEPKAPVHAGTTDSEEPGQTGLAAAVQAVVGGGEKSAVEGMGQVGLREAVEAKQGVEG